MTSKEIVNLIHILKDKQMDDSEIIDVILRMEGDIPEKVVSPEEKA